jgi:translation elongation factor EF-4
MDLCFSHRAEDVDHRYLDSDGSASSRVIMTCIMPLNEIVTDFFDQLKGRSSGFASFECVLPPFCILFWAQCRNTVTRMRAIGGVI